MEQGKYIIRVCSSLSCHLCSSEDILKIIEEERETAVIAWSQDVSEF